MSTMHGNRAFRWIRGGERSGENARWLNIWTRQSLFRRAIVEVTNVRLLDEAEELANVQVELAVDEESRFGVEVADRDDI